MKHRIAVIILAASLSAIAQDSETVPILHQRGAESSLTANNPAFLWSQATLYRDEWGVPHIYADSLRAMAFAFGYAQSEDHLDPMLIAFRAVKGRSAEVLGEDRLPQDTYALQMRFDELAKEAFQTVDPDIRDLCEGFALGVNTWLLEHPDETPDWAEGIQPHEILSLLHAFMLAHAPFDLPEADVRDPGIISANAWAVAPEHSTTGAAMLVINPHAQFEGIYRWYEAHLVAEGYELAGATIYGLPVLLVGHNELLGWSLAPNKADVADLYDENNFQHLKSLERYHDVYFKSGDTLEKHIVTTWYSGDNGPIVATNMGRPLAWKVGGYGNFTTLNQLLAMGRATNIESFVNALNGDALHALNVVYADIEGNIYYAYNAVTGMRPAQPLQAAGNAERTIWEKPVPAYTPGFKWEDPLPASVLPAIDNPLPGYIVGSGTPPSGIATNVERYFDPTLAWLIRDPDSRRAQRTRELFDRGPRSFLDMQSLLFDHAVPEAEPAVDFLLEAAADHPKLVRAGHADLPAALDDLAEWDQTASADSTAMTWYHIWNNLNARLVKRLDRIPDKELLQATAIRAASDASRLLVNTYQTAFVPWGDVHVLRRGDRDLPLSGAGTGDPIFRSGDTAYTDGKWVADFGYAYAMIVQFTDPPASISLVPFGASDRPESPHFSDQMTLLSERRMKILHTARNDVFRSAVSARGTLLEFVDHANRVRVTITSEHLIEGRLVTAHRFDRRTEDGLVAFTPFVEPVVTPGTVDITLDFVFIVPDSVCSTDALEELAVYAFHPQTGWNIVDDQSLDPRQRIFTARDYYDQVYVVLGPAHHLRLDPLATPDNFTLAEVPVQILPDTSARQRATARTVATESIADPLAEALEEKEDREPPKPLQTARPEDNPFGASPGVLVYNPDESDTPPWRTDMPEVADPEFVPPQTARIPEPIEPQPETGPRPPAPPSTTGAPRPPAPTSTTGEPGYERDTRNGDTIVIRGRGSSGDEALPNRASGSRLSVSYEPPSDMRGATQPEPFQLYLAPGNATASQLQIGKDLDISPPVQDIILLLHARSEVRAQGYVINAPPSPFPDGLTAFTPIVAARHAPRSVPSTVAVTLRVSPTVCNPANAQKLTLYVHDSAQGWSPLESATNPVPLSYQAIDIQPRTYAVLGPSSLKQN